MLLLLFFFSSRLLQNGKDKVNHYYSSTCLLVHEYLEAWHPKEFFKNKK